MTADPAYFERLRFLQEVTRSEVRYLTLTDTRLFPSDMTSAQALTVPQDPDLAERVNAFVAHFGRLQDGLATSCCQPCCAGWGEPVEPMIDNLALAERWQ